MAAQNGGQFVLLTGFPNHEVWSSNVRCFGHIASSFVESRVGSALVSQWYKTIDDEQG